MDFLLILKSCLLKAATRLPRLIVQKIWPQDKLAKLILIDVRPRGYPLEISGRSPRGVRMYLRVWNMCHFPIHVESLTVEIWCNGILCHPLKFHERKTIPATHIEDFFLQGGENVATEEHFSAADTIPEAEITIKAQIDCGFCRIDLINNDKGFIRPKLTNVPKELLLKQA